MHEDVEGYMLPALHARVPFCRRILLGGSIQRKALNMTLWLPHVLQALQRLRTVSIMCRVPYSVEFFKCTHLCSEFHAAFSQETEDATI